MCGAFARHERVSIIANRHGDGGILTVKRITLQYTTVRCNYNYTTLHYITLITTHHNYNCNCNYTTLITLHYNYNSTTLQLQLHLELHHTTLHSAAVCEVSTATIASTPKNTTPTTFRSISGFAVPFVGFTATNLSYRFLMFETCATALCGTSGK